MKKKKYLLLGIAGLLMAMAAVPYFANANGEKDKGSVIPQGVYVGEIPIGGMTLSLIHI